jgi:hypothetical protein
MRHQKSWYVLVPAVLITSLWLTGCEPQRPEVVEETRIEEADTDRAPPAVEPVVDREREEEPHDHDDPALDREHDHHHPENPGPDHHDH